jgi:hypothetical protein
MPPVAHIAAIPAIAKHGTQNVVSLAHQIRHIVGLVLQAVFVAGPARGEYSIAHALPIQPQFIEAQAGGVDAGGYNAIFCLKAAAQQRGWLRLAGIFVPIWCDPRGLPIAVVQQAHFPKGGFAPG